MAKVMVIGLDGGTFELLMPWIKAGELPTLRSLMEHGLYGCLRSTIPMFTPTAWSSFMTGMNPGKHGITGFIVYDRRSGRPVVASARNRRGKEIWTLLSGHGKHVVVINVPMTYPPKPVNGVLISGFPAPSHGFTYPPELESWLKRRGYKIQPGVEYEPGREDQFISEVRTVTRKRAEIALELMRSRPWDFFMVVFTGTDDLQHALWRFLDERHPLHEPSKAPKYREEFLSYYKEVDAIIGQMAAEAGPDTYTIVMSDHGFGPLYKFIHVNVWLMLCGLLKLKSRLSTRLKELLYSLGLTPENIYYLMSRLHLASVRQKLGREKGHELLSKLFLSADDVDWERSLAFSLGSMGQIYINRRRVKGLRAYLRLRRYIASLLKELRDPETGERVVEQVFFKEQIYRGPLMYRMPDVVFLPRPGYVSFEEYEFASNRVFSLSKSISGTHRPYGVLIISHPGLRGPVELRPPPRMEDLAPTILRLMGVPVPREMDGKPLLREGVLS